MNGFILHVQGPMMSFADTGFGQLRESGRFPSRSVILGIIAAARGIPRNDERLVELHAALRVHCACVLSGSLSIDYHTVKPSDYEPYDVGYYRRTPERVNSVETYRGYHQDAHFVALVEGEPDAIAQSMQALDDPIFTPFLGRRACPPATPLRPEPIADGGILDALVAACTEGMKRRQNSGHPAAQRGGTFAGMAFLDGDHLRTSSRRAILYYRRDLLVNLPRSYVNRPVTELPIEYALPQTQPRSSMTNEEVFDALP